MTTQRPYRAATKEEHAMGKTYNRFGLIICGALSALLIGAPAGAQTTTFTATYKANSSGTSCTATDNINGVEPSASGS